MGTSDFETPLTLEEFKDVAAVERHLNSARVLMHRGNIDVLLPTMENLNDATLRIAIAGLLQQQRAQRERATVSAAPAVARENVREDLLGLISAYVASCGGKDEAWEEILTFLETHLPE